MESGRLEAEKKAAAEAAAALVEDGMAVGLGTGSTVAHLLPALAARGLGGLRCVATSPATERAARELGIEVGEFAGLERLDIAIDGADQVAPGGWLVKGGGGAHLREKIVAVAAARFVVIVDSSKTVDALRPPLPLELFGFGADASIARLAQLGEVRRRDAPAEPRRRGPRGLPRRDRRPGGACGAARGGPRPRLPRALPRVDGERGAGGRAGRSRAASAGARSSLSRLSRYRKSGMVLRPRPRGAQGRAFPKRTDAPTQGGERSEP